MAICELSDLDETMCGCRLHKPQTETKPNYPDGMSIRSKITLSTCKAGCGDPICEGDLIYYSKDYSGWVCKYCWEELQ